VGTIEEEEMTKTLDALAAELEAWCKDVKLPFVSADELISRDIPFEQKRWLANFLDRWEAADTGSLSMLEQDDEDQAEQLPHVWYPMGTPLREKSVLLLYHPPFEDKPVGYQIVEGQPLPDGMAIPPPDPGQPTYWMIIEEPMPGNSAAQIEAYINGLEEQLEAARDALRAIADAPEGHNEKMLVDMAREALSGDA
jgi:hypothetical protein